MVFLRILSIFLFINFYQTYLYNKCVDNSLLLRNNDRFLLENICNKISIMNNNYSLSITELDIYLNECHELYDMIKYPAIDYEKSNIIKEHIFRETINLAIIFQVLIFIA